MMGHEKKRLWVASLDGQLSASEAADFQRSISAGERKLLELEMAFESEVAKRLSEGADCPDEVWQRVDAKAKGHITAGNSTQAFLRSAWFWSAAAAAAAVVVAVLSARPYRTGESSGFLAVAADVDSLSLEARVGPDLEQIRHFVVVNGFEIGLKDLPGPAEAGGHTMRFLGAGLVERTDGNGLTVLVSCCEEPIRLIVARKGTALAGQLTEAEGGDGVLGVRVIGDYVAAAVGRHGSSNLLGLLG